MATRSPTKLPKANLETFFLARKSGLFRPGADIILAFAGPSTAKKYPSQDLRNGRPKLGWSGGGGGAFDPNTGGVTPVVPVIAVAVRYGLYAPNNPVAWPAGTATAPGTTGVPTWSLANSDGGNFQIDAATGVISKLTAGVLTTATHSITVAVTGLTPAPGNQVVFIPVAASLDFSQPGNSALGG